MKKKKKKLSKKKRKLLRRRIGFAAASLLIIILVITGVRGYKLYSAAKDAKHNASVVLSCVKKGSSEGLQDSVDGIARDIRIINKNITGFMRFAARSLPSYGELASYGFEALDTAERIMDNDSQMLVFLLTNFPLKSIKTKDGYDMSVALRYLNFFEEIEPEITSLVNDMPDLSPLQKIDAVYGYADKVSELASIYPKLISYLPLAKAFLGDGSDRTYLIVAQNTAEIRACGGFPGSAGTAEIKNGIFKLGDFKSIYSQLPSYNSYAAGITDEEIAYFTWCIDLCHDAEYIPDFERVAEIWSIGYREKNGKSLDGIISLTPEIIQGLLKIIGPIETIDDFVLDGDNAAKFLQNDVYIEYQSPMGSKYSYGSSGNRADALFADVAKKTMEKVFKSVSLDNLNDFLTLYEDSVRRRIIMIWFADEQGEQLAKDMGCSGALNFDKDKPELGIFYSNMVPSKLGWYLDMDINVSEPALLADGSNEYKVSVHYLNTITTYEADVLGGYIIGTEGGALRSFMYYFAPMGGDVYDFDTTWGDIVDDGYYKGLTFGHAQYLLLGPGEELTVSFKVKTAPGVQTPVRVVSTPTLSQYR